MQIVLREISTQNWITLLLVGCLLLLATAKFFYNQQFIDVIRLSGADRFLNTRARGSYFFQPVPLALLIIQFVAASYILYLVFCLWMGINSSSNLLIYSYILLGYSVFEIIKIALERFIGYLLDIYKKMQPYFYKKITIKNWIGLFLLGSCFFATYAVDTSLTVLYVLIGLATLFYVVYNFWLLSSYSELALRYPLYFILYFCTLEIAPYYILYAYATK